MVRYTKDEEEAIIKLLRFRNKNISKSGMSYMPIKHIAKFVNRSYSHVHKKCQKLILESEQNKNQPIIKTR